MRPNLQEWVGYKEAGNGSQNVCGWAGIDVTGAGIGLKSHPHADLYWTSFILHPLVLQILFISSPVQIPASAEKIYNNLAEAGKYTIFQLPTFF